MQKGNSANLDLLRAVAVLLVLAQHLLKRCHVDWILWIPTGSLGLFGVLIFFVHTCLVLMYSMERSTLSGWALAKNFYVRRIFRIYPLSIVTVFTALVLHLNSDINGIAGLSHSTFPGIRAVLSNFLLVQNLLGSKSIVNVLWSLPFELQMYVFLPFLFLLAHRKTAFWLIVSLWGMAVLAAVGQMHIYRLSVLSILHFVPNFLPGIVAYVVPRRWVLRSTLWPVMILGLISAFTLRPTSGMGWVLCLILGIAIPHFAEIESPVVRWISKRIATYSYGIYLSHQFCIWLALGVLGSYSLWIKLPALLSTLVAVPIIAYHTIEQPMIKVGIRLADKWSTPAIEASEPPQQAVIAASAD